MRYTKTGKIVLIVCGLIALLSFYEIVTSPTRLTIILLGLFILFIAVQFLKKYRTIIALLGILLVLGSILSTTLVWILLAILVILLINENEGLFYQIKDILFQDNPKLKSTEYVTFYDDVQKQQSKVRKEKRKWIGNDSDSSTVYRWHNINYNKFAGDSVIDIGNTILPKDKNYIFIRKTFGNTKILIPKEVSVALDINILAGHITIGKNKLNLTNETVYWRSKRFDESPRQLIITESVLFGNVEVVFI